MVLVWLSLRNHRLLMGHKDICLIGQCEERNWGQLTNQRHCLKANIQMRSHLEWIYQDRRLSVFNALQYSPEWLTISQDLMSYPLEFPWFLEIKFLLLIDERNFNQSSIWHFRSSNFSLAKTTQIPVCQWNPEMIISVHLSKGPGALKSL